MSRKRNSYLSFSGGNIKKKKVYRGKKRGVSKRKGQRGGFLGTAALASIGIPLVTNLIKEIF